MLPNSLGSRFAVDGESHLFSQPVCPWLDPQGQEVTPGVVLRSSKGRSDGTSWPEPRIGLGGDRMSQALTDQEPRPPHTHTPSLMANGAGQTGITWYQSLTPACPPVPPPRPSQTPAP